VNGAILSSPAGAGIVQSLRFVWHRIMYLTSCCGCLDACTIASHVVPAFARRAGTIQHPGWTHQIDLQPPTTAAWKKQIFPDDESTCNLLVDYGQRLTRVLRLISFTLQRFYGFRASAHTSSQPSVGAYSYPSSRGELYTSFFCTR
jgi:hypothetical protein